MLDTCVWGDMCSSKMTTRLLADWGELLHHRRQAGEEAKTEIRVVGNKFNTSYGDISVVVAENNSVVKPKC